MRHLLALLVASCLFPFTLAAQVPVASKYPNTNTATTAPAPVPNVDVETSRAVPAFDRPVSIRLLLPNILSDQKQIWAFPLRVARGHALLPAALVLGATGGLLALDPIEGNYFRGTVAYHGFNKVFSSNTTSIAMIAAPVSFYAVGLIRKDEKAQHTALLAAEAVANAEIVTMILKDATKRARPAAFAPNGNLYDSFFDSKGSVFRSNGGFPSGHTIAAFSIATVVARRYGNHRWVPYVVYGTAALVGFSRLTLTAHFTSDVFFGAVLGYSISRFSVLRQ